MLLLVSSFPVVQTKRFHCIKKYKVNNTRKLKIKDFLCFLQRTAVGILPEFLVYFYFFLPRMELLCVYPGASASAGLCGLSAAVHVPALGPLRPPAIRVVTGVMRE